MLDALAVVGCLIVANGGGGPRLATESDDTREHHHAGCSPWLPCPAHANRPDLGGDDSSNRSCQTMQARVN